MTEIPDSGIARYAAELVRDSSPASLYNHCVRTYLFGSLLCEHAGRRYDREIAYVGSILHDLALVPPYLTDGPFELAGAATAQEILLGQGYSLENAELVRDSIANHLNLGAEQLAPEIALVHLGAAADVVGLRLDRLDRGAVDAIVADHPRLDFKREVAVLLEAQVATKPESTIARLYKGFSFRELIVQAPFQE